MNIKYLMSKYFFVKYSLQKSFVTNFMILQSNIPKIFSYKIPSSPSFSTKQLSQTNENIINNISPICKNCIHYKPDYLYTDFTSTFNKCSKFGVKNIINGEINYNYADLVRNDETKCGKLGNYFEEEKNINIKIVKHYILSRIPIFLLFLFGLSPTIVMVYILKTYNF